MNSFEILIDSDAFIGWLSQNDALHERVVHAFDQIRKDRLAMATTSLVVAETATTLSRRISQKMAVEFLSFVEQLPIIHMTEDLQREALALFKAQSNEGTSVVDCANVVVMQRLSIP